MKMLGRYFKQKKKEEAVSKSETDPPVFDSDVVDTQEIASEEVAGKLEKKIEQASNGVNVKSVMKKRPA